MNPPPPRPIDQIDLARLPAGHSSTVRIEPVEDPAELKWRLQKERTLFFVGLVLALAVAGWCAYVVVTPGTAEDKRWPQSILTLIIGGFIGYWTKK